MWYWVSVLFGVIGVFLVGVLGCLGLVFFGDDDLELRFSGTVPENGFSGKSVVVVGASSGIGAAVAKEVSKLGARVVLSARRKDRLDEVAKECKSLGAASVHVLELDVLSRESHVAYKDAVLKVLGDKRVDYLVLNAGRSQRQLVETTDVKVDEDMMALNVLGIVSLAKAFLGSLVERKCGEGLGKVQRRSLIAVTSSVAGILPNPCAATYSMSKHAIHGFFDVLRAESAYRGCDVTLVCPGPVQSEIVQHAFGGSEDMAENDQSKRISAERCAALYVKAMYNRIPQVWIAPQPVLLFTYLSHYLPSSWSARAVSAIVGPKRTEAMASTGHIDYSSVEKVNIFSILFSAFSKPKAE